jgi:hypothetical protein
MSATETVLLRGGLSVPLPALRLLWDLEQRGFHVRQAEDGALLVSPRSKLTPGDDQAIRIYKDGIKALVAACEVM